MVPRTATDIKKVEAVQRGAARWVYRDYNCTSSVTAMLKDLIWRSLYQRRIGSRLAMLHKVTYDLVAISSSQNLPRNTRLSPFPGCLRLGLSWFKWWVSFAPDFQCCYFCESLCLFYLSFNFDFYVSKIMHL